MPTTFRRSGSLGGIGNGLIPLTSGSGYASLAPITATGTSIVSESFTGTIAATLAPITATGQGTTNIDGTLAQTLESITATGQGGSGSIDGTLASTLAPITATGAGTISEPLLHLESAGIDSLLLESGDRLLAESGTGNPLTALTAATLSGDDLLYLVDNPAGPALSRSITAADFKTYLTAVEVISRLATDIGLQLTTDTGDHLRVRI